MKFRVFLAAVFIVPFVTFGFGMSSAQKVSACSCIFRENLSDYESEATAIFRGKVVETNFEEVSADFETTLDPYRIEFQVYEYWKGDVAAQTYINTALDSASCGFNFEEGKEYLVFAYEEDGDLHTNLCSGTVLVEDDANSNDFVSQLGEGGVYFYTMDDGASDDGTATPISETSTEVKSESEDGINYYLLFGLVGLVAIIIELFDISLLIRRHIAFQNRKDVK